MALANTYVQVYGRLGDVFKNIAQAQAPEKFTVQYLKDLGFASTNFRAVIPLLKALGFLSAEGVPTPRYLEYKNTVLARQVMGVGLRDAYSDLFTIRANPTPADRKLIEGKFRSTHNVSEHVAKLMASKFFALLELADVTPPPPSLTPKEEKPPQSKLDKGEETPPHPRQSATLHYNIQIHLPATKDVEVFNAIFKSLKEHLLE